MSFSFRVIVTDNENIEIDTNGGTIEPGTYIINGHKHSEGTAPDAIGIYGPTGSANGSSPHRQ
jgi:hypothetical protein